MDAADLSVEAKEALERSRGLARERGLDRPEPAEILLGLLDSREAIRLLELFKVEPEKLRAGLAFMLQGGAWQTDANAEERIVDLARAEAARLGQSEAGCEHLLLALVREPGSMAAGLVQSVGVTLDPAREAVRFLHGKVPDWQPPPGDLPSESSSLAPMEMVPGAMSHEDAAEILDIAMSNFEVGLSPLDRVIGIGQGTDSSGVLVELIALEIREAGAILLWRTQTAEDRLLGPPGMTVTDDAATTYKVLPASWSGGGRESRGETILTPRPPDGAHTLRIEFGSFGNVDWMARPMPSPPPTREEVRGSWAFKVSLGP